MISFSFKSNNLTKSVYRFVIVEQAYDFVRSEPG